MSVTERSPWVRPPGLSHSLASGLRGAALWAGRAVARLARRLARVLVECDRAQRQFMLLRLQPDRYALNGDRPPQTYAEFLFRCPAAVWHEPSARERDGGAPHQPFGLG